MTDIAIIDYGVGNLRSVEKAFAAVGTQANVTSDEQVLREAKGLVLPGVGAFAACMNELSARGFDRLVRQRVIAGTPFLGVCVGMQMLFEESDEHGKTSGLALLRGRVRRFANDLRVPCVGWNQVRKKEIHPLLSGIDDESFFYFVHSYYWEVDDPTISVGETDYGVTYTSVIAHGDLFGVQFHPEKSQSSGLKLLSNFARRVRSNLWQ